MTFVYKLMWSLVQYLRQAIQQLFLVRTSKTSWSRDGFLILGAINAGLGLSDLLKETSM